jgi:hypothetical protein
MKFFYFEKINPIDLPGCLSYTVHLSKRLGGGG